MIVQYSESDGPTLLEAEDFRNFKLRLEGACEDGTPSIEGITFIDGRNALISIELVPALRGRPDGENWQDNISPWSKWPASTAGSTGKPAPFAPTSNGLPEKQSRRHWDHAMAQDPARQPPEQAIPVKQFVALQALDLPVIQPEWSSDTERVQRCSQWLTLDFL